ncbi:MAG: LD-carboxypeptidase [Mogibacterium sp.]|nr:LD-carboxypeptidase [Mogibacterium sp.]
MIYPKFPKPGDTLGICAPSAGVGEKIESFDLSVETLRNAGYDIAETKNVRSCGYPSSPAGIRGAEFNECFERDDISAVVCASGGDFCIEMLPYINQKSVRDNLKWFVGYSDPTSIEMLLTTKLDIATIYGVNAGAWDWRPLHEYQKVALSILGGDIPVQHSYERYSASGYNEETGAYEMDGEVKWELFMPRPSSYSDNLSSSDDFKSVYTLACDYELNVSGRLIGGCIDVINEVIGTPFEALEGFCARYADDGIIWFFDNYELNPMQLQYAIRKMQLKGLFNNARAVIFGRTFIPREATDRDYLEKLGRVLADNSVPLIWNADIGHTKPSFTIINGAIGHLSYRNGAASLKMELR